MSVLPSPVLRAIEGLAENSGRTLVIAGPPLSGKSALLVDLRTLLRPQKTRFVELRGSYRGRSIPYGGLTGLRPSRGPDSMAPPSDALTTDSSPEEIPAGPMAPIPYLAERLPSRRRSRSERPRSTFLGQPVRERSANEGDPDAYWQEILPEFRGPNGHPIAILIDDGALFDAESREFIISLSRRARLRPLLIAVALDTSVPGFFTWEEAFLGRGDVDWVRFSESVADPRETYRLKEVFDDLPPVSQRVAGFVAMLGGTVGEVVLSRVSRLSFPQLSEALAPATGVGLVKVQEGKVTFPHHAWIRSTVDLFPEPQRREMHLEIADALSALSPEPSLARRVEVARHYLAWYAGGMALRHLLEAAEISLQLLAFDSAEQLLTEAISCLTSLPPAERDPLEPELRLLHARALFNAGRLSEAEAEVREGLDGALRAKVSAQTLTEWMEPLLLSMRVVGPRPSLATLLLELTERCHDAEMVEVEVLFEGLVAEFHYDQNWPGKAQEESLRAALLARNLPEGPLQALALLAVGLSRIEGTPEEQRLAERFLRAARAVLGRARRWELDALAEDLEARLLEARGDFQRAREVRERSIPMLQRAKLLSLELYQQLGLAELHLNRGTSKRAETALLRAHSLSETLHLVPPSPGLLRLWLLEGRQLALADFVEPARDRWQAIVEKPGPDTIPRIRAEAVVRLALLEFSVHRSEEAAQLVEMIARPEVAQALPPAWKSWLPDLERLAPESDRGGAVLPPRGSLHGRREPERREPARHEPVSDRDRPHDD